MLALLEDRIVVININKMFAFKELSVVVEEFIGDDNISNAFVDSYSYNSSYLLGHFIGIGS